MKKTGADRARSSMVTCRSPTLLVIVVVTASAVSSLAAAEENAADLGPLIVTATRRAEPLLDHAGSLTRLTDQELGVLGATHHSEAMNRVPGTYIQRGSGQESLTAIRSPVLTGPGSCGAFLFLENGIPIRPTGFCNVNDLFEVNSEQAQAIEIVRGPGSALYGAGAVHGTVNVLMPAPSQMPPIGIAAEGGPDEYLRARFATSHVGNTTDVGLLGHWTHDGGWRDASGFEESKLNAGLTHRAGDSQLDLRLAATNLNQETAGFIQGFESYKDPELAESNPNPEAYRDAHSARLTAGWQTPISASTRFGLHAVARSSRMEFLQHFLLGKPLEENGQDSAALLLSLDRALAGEARLTIGIDAELSRSTLLEIQDGPTTDGSPAANAIRPAGRHYDYSVDAWSAAAYGQLEWPFSQSWRLTAGLRAEFVNYDYDNHMIAGNTDENGVPCAFGGCLFNRPADRSDEFTNLAPKLSLSWGFAQDQRLYLSLATGFRPPEMTELYRLQRQQSVADLDSEEIRSVELGLRGQFENWSYSLSGFALDKRNVIFRDANGFNVSDGETSHVGVEYELHWSPAAAWRLSAAGTIARHEYEFTRSVEAGEQITEGNDVDTSPHNLHAIRVAWLPVEQFTSELEWLSVGEYFVDAANLNRYSGHELVNLRLRWNIGDSWWLAARANNLLDEAYADRADFAFGNYRYFPGRRRTLFVEIGYTTSR
jgi:outer membrane receptor protein involved in Fe transport